MKPTKEAKYLYYCPCNCGGNVLFCVYSDCVMYDNKGFKDWAAQQPEYEAATDNAKIAANLYDKFMAIKFKATLATTNEGARDNQERKYGL